MQYNKVTVNTLLCLELLMPASFSDLELHPETQRAIATSQVSHYTLRQISNTAVHIISISEESIPSIQQSLNPVLWELSGWQSLEGCHIFEM